MKRSFFLTVFCAALLASTGWSQQTNTNFATYAVNGAAAAAVGMSSPIAVSTMTDTPLTLNLQAFPITGGHPVVMLYDSATTLGNTVVLNAWSGFNFVLDLRDKGSNGYSGDQILFDGFTQPSPFTWTDAGGVLSVTVTLPACTVQANVLNCLTASNTAQFEVSTQALVYDLTNSPFNIRSTALNQGTFDNGYQQFSLSGEGSGNFSFKQGFTFKFYGNTYTSANLSANGFVSFGAVDTTFPSITVASVRTGVPRIMNYYNDLVPEDTSYQPLTRIYALQFTDSNGLRKVKFVHDHLAEFSDTTGPHGGECVITDNDDIAVYVHSYQASPSINTAVGITPGNGGPTVSNFGVDLTAKSGTNFNLGVGGHGYEVYQYFPTTMNPMDMEGFNLNTTNAVGPGVVFLKNTALANTAPSNSGYIIQ